MRALGELSSYGADTSKIAVARRWKDAESKLEMLRSYGFDCEVERHCGFWLIHWRFPKLRLVGGQTVR